MRACKMNAMDHGKQIGTRGLNCPLGDALLSRAGADGEFRTRIEAQHGWQFENSWPSETERAAIVDALAEEIADAK